ncbi:DUF411 domain-containing protein [Myxococcota bacterium]|nr:DUF411 domain-containing protein [Myxococcota bacterium]
MPRLIAMFIPVLTAVFLLAGEAWSGNPEVQVYKTPTCGCCSKWIEHLEANGFSVESHDLPSLAALKRSNGVPRSLSSCHTAFVDGYVIEGHVSAQDIERLLEQRPTVAGLVVPGMPIGSPGMEGRNPQRYDVLTFTADGETSVFSTHQP